MDIKKYLQYRNYVRFIVDKLIRLLTPIIRLVEKPLVRKYSKEPIKYQPVFIIGAPRTGSTVLYQAITNQFQVCYIDNLASKFYRTPLVGLVISYFFYGHKAHNNFSSKNGDTVGMHSPSECGNFWYRWLPKDRHFIGYDDIESSTVDELQKEVTAITNRLGMPLIFKNLNAGQRLRLLQKAFPQARFIYIKRNPIFTVQSILKAKRKLGVPDNKFWSIMPRNVKELEALPAIEQIVKQVFYLEKQIDSDIKLFPPENSLLLDYEDLGQNFDESIKKCLKFIGTSERRSFKNASIQLTEKIKLSDSEYEEVKREINKLDWEISSEK